MKLKYQLLIIIIAIGFLAAFLFTGCDTGLFSKPDLADGSVTVSVTTNNERTLRPSALTVSQFSRIELGFTKGAESKKVTIENGQSSTNVDLGNGVWEITAVGFIKINDVLYEAAHGSGSVNASSQTSVSIELKTGIFEGAVGIFNYNINWGSVSVTEATLDIYPLLDLQGYGNTDFSETVDLSVSRTGSFELLPGYYLLNITAKTASSMAVWNEVVHIYSGQKTDAVYTFAAADFKGVINLSGVVQGGELDGRHIDSAVVNVFGDADYFTRIASVEVSGFALNASAPYYHESAWSLDVPNSFAEKTIYFLLEETLNDGTCYTWNDYSIGNIPVGGKNDIELAGSYAWTQWVDGSLSQDSLSFTRGADGTIAVTTTETTVESHDYWKQQLNFKFPMELNKKYVFEFEIYTNAGSRDVQVEYVNTYPWNTGEDKRKIITINDTPETFTIISDFITYSKIRPYLIFRCGSNTVTGSFSIKILSIKTTDEYAPPDPATGRWTATPVANGIQFYIDLREIPDVMRNGQSLVIRNETTGGHFEIGFGNLNGLDSYEIIYPFVESGKVYEFKLRTWDYTITTEVKTVTAIGGRGDLLFSNHDQLSLVKNGNNLQVTPSPQLPAYFKTGSYQYEFALGESWDDPVSSYVGAMRKNTNAVVDLLSSEFFPGWFNPESFFGRIAGKTCFAGVFYLFDYEDVDIYLNGSPSGTFRTGTIASDPFVYPNVMPGLLTAETHPEGIKLSVRKDQFPAGTTSVQFRYENDSVNYHVNADDWINSSSKYYNVDAIEIIYPFTVQGRSYDFNVEFGSTGTKAEATAVAGGGLGELSNPNRGSLGLIYSASTKTISLSGNFIEPAIAESPKIIRKYYELQFYNGTNWEDNAWMWAHNSSSLIQSVILDETLDLGAAIRMSGLKGFVNYSYKIIYDGIEFGASICNASAPIQFPDLGSRDYNTAPHGLWTIGDDNYIEDGEYRIYYDTNYAFYKGRFEGFLKEIKCIYNLGTDKYDTIVSNVKIPFCVGAYYFDNGNICMDFTKYHGAILNLRLPGIEYVFEDKWYTTDELRPILSGLGMPNELLDNLDFNEASFQSYGSGIEIGGDYFWRDYSWWWWGWW